MTIDEVVKILNASQPKPLTALQEWLLRQAWEGKTYTSMAIEANYVEEYLRKTASGLWSILSELSGETITKNNYRSILESRHLTKAQRQLIQDFTRAASPTIPEFPSGPLSVDSQFYIVRPPIEQLAYEELTKPGSIIRIKAPSKFGKSSLMLRLMSRAVANKYRTVLVDFQQAEKAIFTNLNKFLRWFSANVARELQLESKLDNYWDEDVGSKVSCTLYFESYVLDQIKSPIVLALNEVNRLFEYPEIAQDFLPLLRFWHEQAKKKNVWQKLRIIFAYSTEVYIPIKLNHSPFNIGLPLNLPPFNLEQVQELAKLYGLDWNDASKAKRLMAMVGGHPYLIQLAFYHFYQQEITLKQLLEQAVTSSSGIYNDHLLALLEAIEEHPKLKTALKQVINADRPVKIDPIVAKKLDSMGLVHLDGASVSPSCELYRLYFKEKLFTLEERDRDTSPMIEIAFRHQLETETKNLQYLANLDEISLVANRRYFNLYLQAEWQRSAREHTNLSLILCEIDFFKTFNKVYGDIAAEECLRQVAKAIDEVIQTGGFPNLKENNNGDLIARYDNERFIIILPNSGRDRSLEIAESIRQKIKDLAIVTNNFYLKVGGFPANFISVSVGVASTIGHPNSNCNFLVQTAEKALYQSKREGRDRVTFMPLLD